MKDTHSIKLNSDFRRLYARGKSVVGGYTVVYARKNKLGRNRFGFTVGKSVGKAVIRNRTKRLLRESVRLMRDKLNIGYDMIVVARNRAVGKNCGQIFKDLEYVFRTLKIIDGDDG